MGDFVSEREIGLEHTASHTFDRFTGAIVYSRTIAVPDALRW